MATENKKQLLDDLRIDHAEPSSSRVQTWMWLLPVVIAIAAIAYAWQARQPEQLLVVQTATVRPSNDASIDRTVLDATGYVTARRQATVSSKVTGKVVEVLIEEGMSVEQDQLLARLDDSLIRASVELSRAQHDSARAQLQEVRVMLHEAELNFKRSHDLQQRQLASQQELDAARANVDVLKARLASLESSVVVAQRAVDVQQQQLDDTLIRAPFAGVVVNKAAQPGEIVSPVSAGGGFTRTGICTIVDMDSLEVEVDVSESYINRVYAGQQVTSILNSYQDWQIESEVITIIPSADRNRATVRVRIGLLEKDSRILPDMGVKVSFLEQQAPGLADEPDQTAPQRLLIPASAILQRDDQKFVYVYRNDSAEQRWVSVGDNVGDYAGITSGLNVGERVITNINEQLAQQLESGVAITTQATQAGQ